MAAERILLVRTSALGDIVHTLPVLTALRRNRPEARIGWVVEENFAELLTDHPLLDEVLAIGLRSWRKKKLALSTWRELGRFLSALDRFSPEIVLDLMGNHKAAAIAALTLCDRRIGLARSHRREPSSALWLSETVNARGDHAVDFALSLLDALGLEPADADFAGDKLMPASHDITLEDGIEAPILLHPGTGWANKDYPADRWGAIARILGEQTGKPIRVSSAAHETELAERVSRDSRGHATPLAPTSLPVLAAWARRACLFLGGDTGPLHLAHALGTPVLCVMGPTDPVRNGPYGAPQRALWHQLPCSFCYRRFNSVKACLLEIEPETVAARALDLLAEAS